MFHFWFHTHFVEGTKLRLEKEQLDNAHNDKHGRFVDEFALELYFAPLQIVAT